MISPDKGIVTRRSLGSRLGFLNKFGALLGLFIIFGLFTAITSSDFASIRNIETIARQTTVVGTAALGMTMVIILGGIDLSVGSAVALSTVVIALVLGYHSDTVVTVTPMQGLLAGLAGIGAGALCGLVNGLLITRLKVVPFIVTLGTMLAVTGVAKGLANDMKVNCDDSWLNSVLAALGPDNRWLLLPVGVWIMLILAVVVAFILKYTRFGRHVFAVGSNEQTARLCGISVERVKLLVYVSSAALVGLAGLMQFSRLTIGDPTVAKGLELQVIAAVVIGGGSLSGGEGSIFGTLVGALIVGVIGSGCSQMGLPNWVQEIATGCIIVVAVALDRLRHRRAI
ncbi:MAG: ABC transporter permease [Armatimonadota bacterium]